MPGLGESRVLRKAIESPHGPLLLHIGIPARGTALVAEHAGLGGSVDTGCGIPTEYLPRIFDRLYRANAARSSPDGSGLGLAICRAIVQAHHGWIELQSTLGEGTTIIASLPTL